MIVDEFVSLSCLLKASAERCPIKTEDTQT